MANRTIIILIFLCTLFVQANSQPTVNQDYYTKFRNYGLADGMHNLHITDLIQDTSGYMWIATREGLHRFDGHRFDVFLHIDDDSCSLSDNYISSLAISKNNQLYVGTKKGLCLYNPLVGKFTAIPLAKGQNEGLKNEYIRAIAFDNAGTLWIETADGTLTAYRNGNFRHFSHKPASQLMYDYHCVSPDDEGNIWLGGRDTGPYVLEKSSEKLSFIPADPTNSHKKRDNDIACIFHTGDSNIWMSATDGFYHYNRCTDVFTKLLGTSTYDILEDNELQLWLATGYGLHRYNRQSKTFTRYSHHPYDKYSIANNHLTCLFLDREGNIWIGTEEGLSALCPADNYFKHYRHLPENNNTLASENISSFALQGDTLWVGSMDKGLNLWVPKTDYFQNYNTESSAISSNKISTLLVDSENQLWIGFWSGVGFNRACPAKNQFERFALDKNSFKMDWYAGFLEDNRQNFWVGIWGNNGLWLFDRKKQDFLPEQLRTGTRVGPHSVFSMDVADDKLWVSIFNGILYCVDSVFTQSAVWPERAVPFRYWENQLPLHKKRIPNQYRINGISAANDSILIISSIRGISRYNTVSGESEWLTTPDTKAGECLSPLNKTDGNIYGIAKGQLFSMLPGINHLTWLPLHEKNIKTMYTNDSILWLSSGDTLIAYNTRQNKSILLSENIASIKSVLCISQHGRKLLIGTQTGLKVIDLNVPRNNWTLNDWMPAISHKVQSILVEGNQLWIGTDKGLWKTSFSNETAEYFDKTFALKISQIKLLGKKLLLGTQNGIFEYNLHNDTLIAHNENDTFELASHLTSYLFQDKNQNIWVGSTNLGMDVLIYPDFKIRHFLPNNEDSTSFWGEGSSAICELPNGEIWVGGEGINRINLQKDKISHLTTSDGLPSNQILSLTTDIFGCVWANTPSGLARICPQTMSIKVFGENNGIEPSMQNTASVKCPTGEILLGTKNGFLRFSPMPDYEEPKYRSSISKIQIMDSLEIYSPGLRKQIELSYKQNFFTLYFTALNYSAIPDGYYYQLVGVDPKPQYIDASFVRYTNISHGKYKFIMWAKNEGNPEQNYSVLSIRIRPPFWLSWWFILLEVLTGLGIIALIAYAQIKRIRVKQTNLELHQKLLRAQLNPHFVFNALIAIQSFIFRNNPAEAGKYLSKFAKLMRLFLNNSREEFIPLSRELETLGYYLEMQSLRFNHKFDYELSCAEDVNPDSILIPPMMAQPLVENCIEHGFRNIEYQGKIDISYCFENNKLSIIIEDNGIGIEHREAIPQNQENHAGVGTKILRERLWNFTQKHNQKFQLITQDLAAEGKTGTRAIIELPTKTAVL